MAGNSVGTTSAAIAKSAGRLAEQNRDRVLELRALDAGVDGLRLGGLELRLGLSDVGARRDADRVLVARQLQRALIGVHRVVRAGVICASCTRSRK